jgi:hypothetical protein
MQSPSVTDAQAPAAAAAAAAAAACIPHRLCEAYLCSCNLIGLCRRFLDTAYDAEDAALAFCSWLLLNMKVLLVLLARRTLSSAYTHTQVLAHFCVAGTAWVQAWPCLK